MEVIIFIGLVAVALLLFYSWNKKDVPTDVVKTEQEPVKEEAPYKVEAAEVAVPPVVDTPAPAAEPAKPARKTAAKKTAAKKTAAAKKPAAKKKSA